ncbi:MAG: gliding motility lipoprotein GldH [Bacteroidales bacterium]
MKSRILVVLILLPFVFISCSRNKVFEERHVFKQMNWNRFESIFFELEIKDIESEYSIMVKLRHHTVYPFTDLAFTMAIYSPSGERRLKDINAKVRDENNSFLGSGAGDLWDLDIPVFDNFSFNEPGPYKIELENRMSKFDTPGIIDIGLMISKKSKE